MTGKTDVISVGYCHPFAPISESTAPKPLKVEDVKQRNTLRKDTIFRRCPAVQSYMVNSFRVNYPVTANIKVQNQELFCDTPKFLQNINGWDSFFAWTGNALEACCTDVFFFCDVPGVKVLMHPHKDGPLPCIVPSIVDTYKFPRSTHACAFLTEGQEINIKRGDPAYIVTFITPNEERVRLVPCDRPEVMAWSKERETYNRATGVMKWKHFFTEGLRFKPKNQVEKFSLDKAD